MAEADAMHRALMLHANALAGCTGGSEEDIELQAFVDVIEAYEVKRWPLGKRPERAGRKGLGSCWRVFTTPGVRLQIVNEGRSTPKADSLRLTLCAI
jgi:hypothetical protein